MTSFSFLVGHIQAVVGNIDIVLSDTDFEDLKRYVDIQTYFDRDRDYPDEPKQGPQTYFDRDHHYSDQDLQSYSNSGYPDGPDHSSTKKDKLPMHNIPITREPSAKPLLVR